MHYYYGRCEHCNRDTYRWPTNDFFQHMDGTRVSECATKMSEEEYLEQRAREEYEAWKTQTLEDDEDADVSEEAFADFQLSCWEALYEPY